MPNIIDSSRNGTRPAHPPAVAIPQSSTPKVSIGKRKRVVPDALRRRTAVSCDRCKLRRAKCIRASTSDECSNCISAGVACESTLPRKHRVYGSLESLSLRYRALDALLKGLLPNENLQDVDSLLKIGKSRGIPMPEPDFQATNPEIFQNGPIPQTPPTPAPDSVRELHRTSNSQSPLRPTPKKIRDEKLVAAPHGVGHYVGPSSSLGFAAVVRKMVARTSSNPKFMLSRRQQKTSQAGFVRPSSIKGLEPPEHISPSPVDATPPPPHPQDGGVYLRLLDAEELQDQADTTFILPDRATADTLIQGFFDHVHSNYPLFHRTIFHLQYEAMLTSNKHPDESDPGWICTLCLIFVFGAQALEPFGKQAAAIQRRYLRIARSYVDHLVSTTSDLNIQALMLLQLYYHNAGERNASWMLLGCASRMAIALGMHREGANVGFDSLEQNIRKQIWWTVYVFEKNLCIILGRPSAIEDSEITITYPEEAIESSIGLPGLTAVTASLTRLAFRAKQQIYNPSDVRSPSDGDALTSLAKVLLQDFKVWYDSLPAHLRVGRNAVHVQQRRAVLLLDILYHHARALVTRPFLISRVNKQIDMVEQKDASQAHPNSMSDDAVRLADQCVADAHAVVAQGSHLYKEGLLNGMGWLDVYYIYQSCFIISLNFIPQLADIPESPENQARKAAVDEILTALATLPLAPTFRTLIQVGSQFASLVGAMRDPYSHLSRAFKPSITSNPIVGPATSTSQAYTAPSIAGANTETYHSQPPAQTTLGANVNRQDWMNATQIPWDFLGRTEYGQSQGFSREWYAVQSGTYDDMMFPTVVGGTFGQGYGQPFQYDGSTSGYGTGDEWVGTGTGASEGGFV